MWIHTVLALSHLVSLPALHKALKLAIGNTSHWECQLAFPLLFLSNVASIFMHLSETKHGLIPDTLWLQTHSSTLLNLDRIAAHITALYFLRWWWLTLSVSCRIQTMDPIAIICFGGLCLWIGERTMDQLLYFVLHLIWHVCAFASIDVVLQRQLTLGFMQQLPP